MKRLLILLAIFLIPTSQAFGGWFGDAVKSTFEGLGRRAVGEAGDSAYEGAKGKTKETVSQKQDPKQGEVQKDDPGGDRNPAAAPSSSEGRSPE